MALIAAQSLCATGASELDITHDGLSIHLSSIVLLCPWPKVAAVVKELS
jgi:hypothetical protein